MGYSPDECIKQITDKKRIACDNLQLAYHCDTLTGVGGDYHDECVAAGVIYFQVRVAECYNPKTGENKYFPPDQFFQQCNAQGPDWQQRWCYCCCACFAKDTLIAVPGGVAEIYTIPVGAQVLAGSVHDNNSVKTSWSETRVKFSMGTGEGHQPMMVYINFGEDNKNDLICTQDQPFLLHNGKFITAGKLVPGQTLVDKDGNEVIINLVSMGSYDGAVHHISTSKPWAGNPNGHLLLAGGVVVGDFEMQLKFDSLPESMKVQGHSTLPSIGTPEYDAQFGENSQQSEGHFEFTHVTAVGPEVGKKRTGKGVFKTYRRGISNVPHGARQLLTKKQAGDVRRNGKQVPLSDPMPKIMFDTVKGQLSGFYPDIDFYYDALDTTPNVYAFEAYGRKIVQVAGGFARLTIIDYEGLAMAMGHGIGCFKGGAPMVTEEYSAVGEADRYAFGAVCSKLWIGDPAFAYITRAIDQWESLFALVSKEHAQGNPKDPLNNPSLACRTKVIQSAPFGGGLPECAGGEPKPKLWLEQATADKLDTVNLVFNLALEPNSANNPANYTFMPGVEVIKAQRDSQRDFEVNLTVKLQAGKEYKVTAKNLVSALGTGLDPEHVSATFKSPG